MRIDSLSMIDYSYSTVNVVMMMNRVDLKAVCAFVDDNVVVDNAVDSVLIVGIVVVVVVGFVAVYALGTYYYYYC